MRTLVSLFVATTLFMVTGAMSCERQYNYTYKITNQTDTTLAVAYRDEIRDAPDTVIYASPGATTTVFATVRYAPTGHDEPPYRELRSDFRYFKVFKGGDTSTTDFYHTNGAWTYDDGVFQTTVAGRDF